MLKFLMVILLAVSLSDAVSAEENIDLPNCGLRSELSSLLAEQGAIKIGVGISDDGQLTELYSNSHGSAWLIVATEVAGGISVSCVTYSGTDWRTMGAVGEIT